MRHKLLSLLSILMFVFLASTVQATTFDFATDNQGWSLAGFYDDGGLVPISGFFSDGPAPWSPLETGVILLGSGGATNPASPTGDSFIHWDLNSPDLSADSQWQGIQSFTYDVSGEQIAVTGDTFVQAVLLIQLEDGTDTFFTDGIFNQIFGTLNPGGPTPWTTYTVDMSGLPAGSTLTGLNMRFFFQPEPFGHDGYFLLDNVTPGSKVPEPVTMLLLGTGLLSLVGCRRKFKK